MKKIRKWAEDNGFKVEVANVWQYKSLYDENDFVEGIDIFVNDENKFTCINIRNSSRRRKNGLYLSKEYMPKNSYPRKTQDKWYSSQNDMIKSIIESIG